MNYIFPISFMVNNFSFTLLMVCLGLLGKPALAADFAIVQGATLALFYSFSANARNLILKANSPINTNVLFGNRIWLSLPLGVGSLLLCTTLAKTEPILAILLIIRRIAEWLFEVYLSEVELRGRNKSALQFIYLQFALFTVALVFLNLQGPFPYIGLAAWAILPFLNFRNLPFKHTIESKNDTSLLKLMAPHFGSTSIIGISIYLFRVIIINLVDKTVAGDLFVAFSIGGLFSSVFSNALGPSIIFQKYKLSKALTLIYPKIGLSIIFVTGIIIAILSELYLAHELLLGKTTLFWSATGLSLAGSVLMIIAHYYRLSSLQNFSKQDVFAPDLLANLAILSYASFGYFILGDFSLKTLFLFNSIVSLILYYFSYFHLNYFNKKISKHLITVGTIITIALILPIFFQLTGNIFISKEMVYDTKGMISRLPIPISVVGCFIGILLIGNFNKAREGLYFIFLSFLLIVTLILVGNINDSNKVLFRLILMMQFILPMFGLILGQTYENTIGQHHLFEKSIVYILTIIIPFQLIVSWVNGSLILMPNLYFFSVYQHLQYIPDMFICLFIIALFTLWDDQAYRYSLIFLTITIGIYALASLSRLSLLFYAIGLFTFFVLKQKRYVDKLLILTIVFSLLLTTSYYFIYRNAPAVLDKANKTIQIETTKENPKNVLSYTGIKNLDQRIYYWTFYISNIIDSSIGFMIGHSENLDRNEYPSAHNYYLDLIYHFGFVSLTPVLLLLIYTLIKIYRLRYLIINTHRYVSLIIFFVFIIIGENMLKVGLRQPYPGILSFFVWGVLLSVINRRTDSVIIEKH